MRGRYRLWQPVPSLAAVEVAVERDRRRTGVHDVRAGRMVGQRPDHYAAIRKAKPLPMVAAIGAAVGDVLCPDEDHMQVARMHTRMKWTSALSGRPAVSASQRSSPAVQRNNLPRNGTPSRAGGGSGTGEDPGFAVLHSVAPFVAIMARQCPCRAAPGFANPRARRRRSCGRPARHSPALRVQRR